MIETCIKNLEKHGFEVLRAENITRAGQLLRAQIVDFAPQTIAYGDSMSVRQTGIIEELLSDTSVDFLYGFDPDMPREERIEIRRRGLLADFFFTGINAVGADGSLHWLDMIGNRIAPVIFGPRKVVLIAGRNKIVANRDEAVKRIRAVAAPQNVARHTGFKTPCATTGVCTDCNSPQRICNAWLTLDRCFPRGRITVILVDEDLGL